MILTDYIIFCVTSPFVNSGVTLVGNVISGTPTTITTAGTFTVRAITSVGSCVGTVTYTFNVLDNPVIASVDNALSNLVKVSPNPSSVTSDK